MINYKQVQKVYQKVKSDIYYSNNIFYKKMIVEFESSSDKVECFKHVAKIYNGTIKIDELLSKISIMALPKNVDKKETSEYIINSKQDIEILKSVNFFICAPIEIFLIDALWTIRMGGVIFEKELINKDVVYGNILNDFKLYNRKTMQVYKDEHKEEFEQINFYHISKGVSFFKPYFHQYKNWRNKAFSSIKKIVKNKQNALMINYDIKQFYYNYHVSFREISKYITHAYTYETKIIERIYSRYQGLLLEYKNLRVIKERYPLPIGLFSSRVISNIALARYDERLSRLVDDNDGFYGRYVDDMYFVIPLEENFNQKKHEVVDCLINKYHFLEKKDDDYIVPEKDLMLNILDDYQYFAYSELPTLLINSQKMDVYVFYHNEPNILSKIYDTKMLMSVSDAGYLMDFDYNEKNFFSDLFKYKDSKYGFKISDLKSTILDKYELSLTLTKLINFYKNLTFEPMDKRIEKIQKSIFDLFNNMNAIKFYQLFEKLFILLSILGYTYVGKMKNAILKVINQEIEQDFSLEEYKDNEKVLFLVKDNLKKCLEYSVEEGISLIYISSVNNEKINSEKWLNSLMINKNLFLSPLIQLSKENVNIFEMKKFNFEYELDEEKIKYVPFWINFQEFYFYEQLKAIKTNKYLDFDSIMERYFKINGSNRSEIFYQSNVFGNEFDFFNHNFLKKKKNFNIMSLPNQKKFLKQGIDESMENFRERFIKYIEEQTGDYKFYKIGVVSIPLEIDKLFKAFNKRGYIDDLTYKVQINHVLNEALHNKVNHLIFPELSIPPTWVNDIILYGLRHKIQITFGLQYLYDRSNRIYNTIMSIYPFTINGVYNLAYISLREKRYYPYSEKAFFENKGFLYKENNHLKQEIVCYRGGRFTNFLCYELTSISDRAILRNEVNVLLVPVLNKDTNYFSSIVDSTARELFCYVSMSNTSVYGDSRITGPFGTNEKDIVRLKGGNNVYCVVGEIDLNELELKRKTTDKEHLNKAKANLEKHFGEKYKRKYKPLSAGINYDKEDKFDDVEGQNLL